MNIVILIGRLTRDPEIRYIPSSGNAVTNFDIAVDRSYQGSDGNKKTDFFKIEVWGKKAESCANYLAKGRLVAVKGSIQNRSYDTTEGEKRYITEIVAENVQFLEWGDKNKAPETNNTYEPEGLDSDGFRALDDADVPF